MNDQEIIDDLNAEFIKPEASFKGFTLRRKNLKSLLLMTQAARKVKEPLSNSSYCALYFYIHSQPIREVEDAVWGGEVLRKMLDLVADYSEADLEQLSNIIKEANQAEENSKVEVQADATSLPDPHAGNE